MGSSTLIARPSSHTSLIPSARDGQTVLELPGIEVRAFRTGSLGNWSYLVYSGGEAAVVDPQRDVEPFLRGTLGPNAPLRYVVETHIHSDYLSGATRLVHGLGSDVVASVHAEYAFPHRALGDGDRIRVGVAELRQLATPGHTREHVAWTLHAEGDPRPVAVFSGGSLIPGGAGRTDVLGSASVPLLTWLQFQSIRTVAELPETTLLLPTHGGGSTCGTSPESDVGEFRTVGQERASNALLSLSYEAFRDALVKDRPPVPASFRSISRQNRLGPPLHPPTKPAKLSPRTFARTLGTGAWAIDLRGRHRFAAEHLLGSLNIEPTDAFLSQLGSIVPHGVPLALIGDPADERLLGELALDCYRVGYPVAGVLDGGLDAWQADRRVVASYPTVSAEVVLGELVGGRQIHLLDVRDPVEWREGTLDGVELISLGRLVRDADQLQGQPEVAAPITVACHGGARAALAASYLARRGLEVRPVTEGGIPTLIAGLTALGCSGTTGAALTAGHVA